MLRLLPLAFLLASVSCLAQSGTVRGDVGAALDTYLTESVSPDFSGVVLAVQDGEVVLRKGYGMADRAAGVANTPETVFQIGSVTKPFTAVAVMTLVDQGLVDPSDLVSAYFDGVPEDKATMTVHHLLTHTAGFPNAIGDDYAAIGRDAYIRLAMQTPLATPPGEAYAYSNVGYALLGAIIEEVTGMSYDAYLQSVMRPIGAEATGYRLGDGHAYAHAYEGSHDLGLPFDRPWAEDGPYWHLRANGGLLSTVDDLYALHLALEEGRLLSPEAYRAMHTEQTDEGPNSDSHYGYGWAIFKTPRDTRLVAHNGGDPGFTADFLRFVDEDAVLIVLSNDRAVDATRLSRPLEEILFGGTPEPFRPVERRPLALDSLPELEMGRRALAFVETINAAEETASRVFTREHLDAQFRRNEDGVVGFFKAVREEMGRAPFLLERAEWDGQEGTMHLFTTLPDGRGYVAEVGFQPGGDHLIEGLRTDYVAPEASGVAGELPDTPAGRTVAALLDALEGDESDLFEFVETGMSPSLRDAYPLDEHLALLRQMQGDVIGAKAENVDARGEYELSIVFRQRPGGAVRLTFQVNPDPPHRLVGVGAARE